MKKLILTALLLCGFGKCYAFGPEKSVQDSAKTEAGNVLRQRIWLNGGQLSRKEIQIGYERFLTPEISIELSLGYKYPKYTGGIYNLSLSSMLRNIDTYDYAERMPFSQGVLVSLALKGYDRTSINKIFRPYISPQIFYRYRFYDYQFITSSTLQPDHRKTGTSLQSLDLQIYGIKILFGNSINLIRFKDEKRLLLDFYTGLGIRFKKARTTYYWYDYKNPTATPIPPETPPEFQPYFPNLEKSESIFISPHLGFKLGYQF